MKKKSEHTPGPWSIDRRACTHVIAGDRGICSASGETDNRDPERTDAENNANAQLIAAAPQMLEALEAAKEALFESKMSHGSIWENEIGDETLAAIKSALAAARREGGRAG